MGFFDTLKSAVTSVIDTVRNNSGTFLKTIEIIAAVAGKAALTEEDYETQVPTLPYMTEAINGANSKLSQLADKEFPIPSASIDWATKTVDFPCFWPTPTGRSDAMPIPEVAIDINRILAMHDIPNTLGKSGVDFGEVIANQCFSSLNSRVVDLEKDIKASPVLISIGDFAKFTGGMIYYFVPLGNEGNEAWHSNMRLHYQYSPEAQKLQQSEKRAHMINQDFGEIGIPYNAATITARWTGAAGISGIMTRAVEALLKGYSGNLMLDTRAAIIDGTRFTYQFKCVINIGPAEVASKLAGHIQDELRRTAGAVQTPTIPEIKVTNLTTIA